jgi:hypothetical protein
MDGMNVSVHLKREIPEWDGVNGHGFNQAGVYHPLEVGDRVVGVDLGCHDLFCTVYGIQRREAVSCSMKEWYTIAGFIRAWKKREVWTEKSGLQNLRGI